jgi:gliding motility-associated-like protein
MSATGLKVAIIESQSIGLDQDMDQEWLATVMKMGHYGDIYPQTFLDDSTGLSSVDLLIISSGEIPLSYKEVKNIFNFIQQGKSVYLQSEHLSSFTTNVAFQKIVEDLGGSFKWKNEFIGNLKGIKVLGSYQNTNNQVLSLDFYWYSVSGEGDCRTINILEYKNEYHGFQYIPVNPMFGAIVTTTDQDWIREAKSPKLMENIITHLINVPKINSTNSPLLGEDTTLCVGDSLILDPKVNGTYKWQDGTTGDQYIVKEKGLYTVSIQSYCGLEFDDIEVDYITAPNIVLNSRISLCTGQSITLDATTPFAEYIWSDNSTSSSITVDEPGEYSIEINNICGSDTARTVIVQNDCNCNIFTPNVFSPNGDYINDNWIVESNCKFTNYHLIIYDRWGTVVFDSNDPQNSWNGYNKGIELPSSVYCYQLLYSFSPLDSYTIKGDITLLR